MGPSTGEMACGEYGEGKMSTPEQIFDFVKNYFSERNIVKNKNLKAICFLRYEPIVISIIANFFKKQLPFRN